MKTVTNQRCDDALSPVERTITADGLGWHYLEWGERGPALVLWHGITSSARNWWRVGPLLAGLGFHVYAPDLPGHGSTDDAPGDYGVAQTARLLDSWLAALGLDAPVIVGHSWGGLNALGHATLPDALVRARALVLEDPAVVLWPDPAPHHLAGFTSGLGLPRNEATLAEIAAANPRWHDCDVWWKAEARQQARRVAVEGFLLDNAGINATTLLHQLTVPTLLLLGDAAYGGIWSAEHVAAVRQSTPPQVTVEVVAGSTHNLHRDSFEGFSMALGRFARQFVERPGR